jgi:hypothetical protein
MARKSEALERWRVKLQRSVDDARVEVNAKIKIRDQAQRELDIAENTLAVKKDLLDEMDAEEPADDADTKADSK